MSVIATATPSVKQPTFPQLRISKTSGFIVLFVSEMEGTVVLPAKNGCTSLGHYSKGWSPGFFEPYSGSLTLTNG